MSIFRTCLGELVWPLGGCHICDPWSIQSSFSWTLPCLMLTVLQEMFSPSVSAVGRALIPRETQTSPHHRHSGTGIGLRLPFVLDPEGLRGATRCVPQHRGGATWASDRRAQEEDPESRDVAKCGILLGRSVTAGIVVSGAIGRIGWWRDASTLLTFQVKGKIVTPDETLKKVKVTVRWRAEVLHQTCLCIKSRNLLQMDTERSGYCGLGLYAEGLRLFNECAHVT